MNRKQFFKVGGGAILSFPLSRFLTGARRKSEIKTELFFAISLAQWSLHRTLNNGDLSHLEFPAFAKNEFGINALEYVNSFFRDKAEDRTYLDEMNKRCADLGVEQLLIMVDGEGGLAIADDQNRIESVENHYKWVEAAEYLGCHSIRVNAFGQGTRDQQMQSAVDGLGRLSEFAKDYDINVIVENHGGYSSDGQWLSEVISQVDMENCGTLPDFGNFCIRRENGAQWSGNCVEEYDRYKGVKELMPHAKAVSAKSYAFDEKGQETTIDFSKMLSIIYEADFSGYIGVEYEGSGLSEVEGIKATKRLLEEAGSKITEG
ncbi:sugar phosphate isomerase/epimerase family protein [Gracilimonas sp.]|uniref:sugar phosphate isomerase/epimerase family protein n=1 Tax=Gracilimonas sp. TaxID=1974203 RepID=UPI00287255D9|nr:sugar phosphate isomerase/epimerase family protein [Gracilimonas sp.]